MTYYYFDHTVHGITRRNILCHLPDGGIRSFPDIESNDGPERQAYLSWVAEGNTAEEWNPNAN